MRKLFKERKLFKGGNYMRKYGRRYIAEKSKGAKCFLMSAMILIKMFYIA